jgi:hypothetical protein
MITTQYGDWGRNGLMAVATRHLGWRLVGVVREIPGLGYHGAGHPTFLESTPQRPQKREFPSGTSCQNVNNTGLTLLLSLNDSDEQSP